MKLIKVLGADNCSTCTNLKTRIEKLIDEKGVDAKVEKITDIMEIMKYGVMSTPSVVVDEQLRCIGRVPTDQELLEWL